jgi:hypothetical protein
MMMFAVLTQHSWGKCLRASNKIVFISSPTNEGTAQVEECFVNRGQSFVAYAQSPELI